MAGSKSDYLEDYALDSWYGSGAPATIYVALYTAAPSDSGGGTEVSTGNWTNYARVAKTNNATNWPAASSGVKANGTTIDFGTAVIPSGTVTVVAFATFDAIAGNMLHWATLTSNKTINNGDPVYFAIGAMTLTED